MKVKNFLIDEKVFLLNEEERNLLREKANEMVLFLKKKIKNEKIKASVFIGGSFAKGTLIKGEVYDIDIFVRAKKIENEFFGKLKKILVKYANEKKYDFFEIHGSRNYFRISTKKNLIFEIVPVKWIRKPKEAENSTDLSYAHVNYVKRKIRENPKLINEIALCKMFCKALNVYGAESYIKGFSGYGIECLIIHYGSFIKFAKEISKVKELLILDPEKHYKSQREILISLNESKLKSPIVLIDPVWKERNVLAALSHESFEKFQKALKDFLKKPSKRFFEIKKVELDKLKKISKEEKAQFLKIEICTEKQEGDIAGTKLKKFSEFIFGIVSKKFDILKKEFEYFGKKNAEIYIIAKPKEKLIIRGPPLSEVKHLAIFKKKYKKTFEDGGRIYAETSGEKSAKGFLKKFFKKNNKTLREMSISSIEIN